MPGTRCYFDILIEGKDDVGRVIFELHDDEVPKTCRNFAGLCEGVRSDDSDGDTFGYKNSKIHRVIPGFLIQGGDITNGDGTGGRSIYGSVFEDENFIRTHSGPGLLCMANSGPDSNCSQFYVTMNAAPHLNGSNIVFGKVICGMDILREIEELHISGDDRPATNVVITDCGITSEGSSPTLYQRFQRNPEDNIPLLDCDKLKEAISLIKEDADNFFKSSEYNKSLLKYEQCLRYVKTLLQMTEDKAIIEDMKVMKVKIYNNSSLCHVKSGNWNLVKKMSGEAVKVSSTNAKANYYVAVAIKEMELVTHFEEAWSHITAAYKESPSDAKILELFSWFSNYRKEQKQKISKKMNQWTNNLEVKDATAVHFADKKTNKKVTLSSLSGGGITYTLNGEPRGRIKKVEYCKSDASLRFPELGKRIVFPDNEAEVLLQKLRELCSTNDVEVTEYELNP
eukprot:TRINITY_DN6413_c0_g1_i1.p1 TRINITY_DN6413_c0_g1~~TRINITY_DN6413_c0_g1_i1.p1  ORF type:complete len:464 (+),score=84.29 TRINITY_DN6413_c0_g1_i1:34-1392(+)